MWEAEWTVRNDSALREYSLGCGARARVSATLPIYCLPNRAKLGAAFAYGISRDRAGELTITRQRQQRRHPLQALLSPSEKEPFLCSHATGSRLTRLVCLKADETYCYPRE